MDLQRALLECVLEREDDYVFHQSLLLVMLMKVRSNAIILFISFVQIVNEEVRQSQSI